MKIYISIPITGHDLATQRAKAAEIAERIKALGHDPVNPFDTPEAPSHLSEKEKYAYYMGEDIKRLLLCDAAYFAYHWAFSLGCRIEMKVAETMGLQIFHHLENIPKALKNEQVPNPQM